MLQGVELWKQGKLEAYGELINQSSQSSLHNYEVGRPFVIPCDLLVSPSDYQA